MSLNTEIIFDKLTETVGRFCNEVTGRKVVLTGEKEKPVPAGNYAVIDLVDADPVARESQEFIDPVSGLVVQTHNYQVVYSVIAHRGKSYVDLVRMLQAFDKPYIYDKYFPTGSPFAFASASTVSRIKVPLNLQEYEIRGSVLLTFNVCFFEGDFGIIEDINEIQAKMVYHYH